MDVQVPYMEVSEAGLDCIKDCESLELAAYPDPGSELGKALQVAHIVLMPKYKNLKGWEKLSGHPWTIGYGHTGAEVKEGLVIDKLKAVAYLKQDVKVATSVIKSHVRVPLNQNQFDALTSFVYNVGIGAFMNSTCLRKLNTMDYLGAADEMLRWWHSPGAEASLKKRRAKERDMFLGNSANS